MPPLIEAMRWFVRVADCGSFSAVAREMMTTQVMVGRRISMLEAHFRITLLRRSTRTLTLTDEGRIFLDRAQRILREVDALEAEVHGGGRDPVGHVRIGATSTFGCHLARQLPRFHKQHPGVTVEMLLSDGFMNMVEDGLDLAMRTGQVNETTVIAKHLGDVPRYLVAAPSYVEEHGLPSCGHDLEQHDCVLFSYGATSQIWSVDDESVRVSGTYRTNSSLAQHEAVRMGMGISLFAYFQVEDDVRNGRLIRLLPEARLDPIPFYVTRQASQTLSPRVRLVRDWIIQEARSLIGNAPEN